ncbi:MAG TPA: four helix bundle protein [Bacteroidales bacterium]|nr:MAG: four helix bundle protein [Bacteroidetes bacterium GWF2_33_38]OFY86218.1 MAG: four helix bundle protein [Bacteroidetes bacterium RIFOXYA2_FULL_33_7]HBF89223.1 four helix bundle protein [Bacteroidales bacterium]
MAEGNNIVKEKAFEFAVKIIELGKFLMNEKKEFIISKQIIRSGTSVGANIEESIGGVSKADFSYRLSISYKEARETHYWLRLLERTNYIEKVKCNELLNECDEICKLLYVIIRSTNKNK